jgi:hypothetical protein
MRQMGKPGRGPGSGKRDQETGNIYPGAESKWPGPRISKWPQKLAPVEISNKLLHSRQAMEGIYGESLKGLLQINPVELLPDASTDEALVAYDQLLDVVKQASRKAVGAEHLGAGISKLGPYSIRLAQSTRGLADTIELNTATSLSTKLSPRKG